MTESMQSPKSEGEFLSFPPKVLLGRLIRGISDRFVNAVDQDAITVTQEGYLRLSGARFIMTRIIKPTSYMPPDIKEIAPNEVLCLDVYNSTGDGYLESSVILSGDTDGTVVGNIGDKEFNDMAPDEEDKFIRDFLASIFSNDKDLRALLEQISKQITVA